MPDETDESRRAASPYSTSGAGSRFEHRFGAVLLVRLLTAEAVTALGERAPMRVAFQQSPATGVDDIVATASDAAGTSIQLEIAVRRSPRFIRSNKQTKPLIAALVRADLDAERQCEPLVERRLAVAISGWQRGSHEIAELAVVARNQSTAEAFLELIYTPGKFSARARSRLDQLVNMVGDALADIADEDPGTPGHRSWSLLRRLWIMPVNLEASNEGDWTRLVRDLKCVALEPSDEAALALRNQLEQLAAELASTAGVIDASLLRRRLHGRIRPDAHQPPAGWKVLLTLDERARVTVARALTEIDSTPFTFPRREIREELAAAMMLNGDLIVTGDSGVGKSALVMDAIEPDELGVGRQAIALNMRHLPANLLELLSQLSSSIEELFSELPAPSRILVIDSAEAATEDHREVFTYLLDSARRAAFKLIVIATTEASDIVARLMASAPNKVRVQGLDDNELAKAASRIPKLRRFVDNPRARELLRRPIVIELFAQANDPGLPLSEAQVLEHIWHHLVRDDEQRSLGSPSAREQVMLQLAAHAVQRGDADDLLGRLDDDAVEGLRRSGLLLPARREAWDRVPAFKHDLLRAYSVARFLLRDRDPAAVLTRIGAPRWTLASARLACEIVLAWPEEPGHPRVGRYARLQSGFDAIAEAGAGKRWSDVPGEALLGVPDGADLLKDAWPTLLANKAHGLARLIRVLHGRHKKEGMLDSLIAEPVISKLLESGIPLALSKESDILIRDWLRAHALQGTCAGEPTRIALRDSILDRCSNSERVLDEQVAARQAKLALRTPEEIQVDEERWKKFAAESDEFVSPRFPREPEPTRHRPSRWIREAEVEHLALLGPDLGPDGEALLRRLAEDEPHLLEHAVEPFLAGRSICAYNSRLLIDLAAAYYIEEHKDGGDFAFFNQLDGDGIRDHRFGGSVLASFTKGPFVDLFRTDYRGGVAFLNRMLDHAARYRVGMLSGRGNGNSTEVDRPDAKHVFSINGDAHEYIGDSHVWLWYRGTGVGPYPCMSALQALEFVTEENVRAGVPPHVLTTIMLEGANSLAMPALALCVLVRHLEIGGEAIDPFIVEPKVWQLEFLRVKEEQPGGLAAQIPKLANLERRIWSLGEVCSTLTLAAAGDRIARLKVIGEQLLAKATAAIGDDLSERALVYLADVRMWASAFDRAACEARQRAEPLPSQQAVDPEVERALANRNAASLNVVRGICLTKRHVYARRNDGGVPAFTAETLAADIFFARQLLDNSNELFSFTLYGPFAAAASAVELHFSRRVVVADDDLAWSAKALLQVVASFAQHYDALSEDDVFSEAPDRSAARSLPFLFLPAARGLRATLGVHAADDVRKFLDVHRAVAVNGVNEVRLAYARALDAIWSEPCDTVHLHGRCHHRIAFDLVTESFLCCVKDSGVAAQLDPPEARSLDALGGKKIYGRRLASGLRAMGAAAISSGCCRDSAQAVLCSLLAAHQRCVLAHRRSYHRSKDDELVAARAALWQATDGRDDVVFDYVRGYVGNARALAEALQALTAAAEELPDAGEHASRIWPQVMDLVLDAMQANRKPFSEHIWGERAEAALIPNAADMSGYRTIELAARPCRWRDLLSWAPKVDRWLDTITYTCTGLDQLVMAVQDLEVSNQIEQGIRWIERYVANSGANCVSSFFLPNWLHERRSDLFTDDQIDRWQRVVDTLAVEGDTRVADLAD